MNNLSLLEPHDVWNIFAEICSVPHPSSHEKELSLRLKALAEKHHCQVRFDDYGNMRIDRENGDFDAAIIMQAHMDMVSACTAGKNFDFERQAITPVVDHDVVRADGTTLGGDDGMGVALALAMLFHPDLRKVPLAAVFTREEEIGMLGAEQLPADFLRGKLFINLDSGCDNVFQVGCAGGVRSCLSFRPGMTKAPQGQGVGITLGNFAGGHSGVDIHLGRVNALIFLAKLLSDLPLKLAAFSGGDADNAIPSFAQCRGISQLPVAELQDILQKRADALRGNLTESDRNFTLQVEPDAAVDEVFSGDFSSQFLARLATVPNGPVSYSEGYKSVHTSSNIGFVVIKKDGFDLVTSQRSFVDAERDKTARDVIHHFGNLVDSARHVHPYSGWNPEHNSYQDIAAAVWRDVNHTEARFEVVHAGLECGLVIGKAPNLPIIACFPKHDNLHTPGETMDIASVGRVYKFLVEFLCRVHMAK